MTNTKIYFTEEDKKDGLYRVIYEYKKRNKDIINKKANEKVKCKLCNCEVSRSVIARHEKSKKHLKNIN